jgi:DNA-binding PadR family transcriptional regulator
MNSHQEAKPLKGHWFQILLALADQDLHGLGIMREVSIQTSERMHLWPGMLYGALKRMTDQGLVTEIEPPRDRVSGGGKPRFYSITEAGRRTLIAEVRHMDMFVQTARDKKLLDRPTPAEDSE